MQLNSMVLPYILNKNPMLNILAKSYPNDIIAKARVNLKISSFVTGFIHSLTRISSIAIYDGEKIMRPL